MLRKWYGCHLEWDERQITGVSLILTADAVVQHGDTVFESFAADQVQQHRTMPWRNQRNSFTDKHRNDVHHELVDLACIKKRADDFRAAHHPDILAWLQAQLAGKLLDRLINKLDAGRCRCRRPVSEHVVLHARVELRA